MIQHGFHFFNQINCAVEKDALWMILIIEATGRYVSLIGIHANHGGSVSIFPMF